MSTKKNIATFGCLPIAVLVALVLAFGGEDDTSSDSKPTPTASATKSASPKDDRTAEETAFLLTTRAKIPALEKVPDEQILDLGRSSCTAIDAGNSPAAVAARAEEGLQIGAENSGYIVGAAVSQFCPEHKSKL